MSAHFSDLRRRRSAVIFLLALPFVFYLVRMQDKNPKVAFISGGLGLAWSVACAALFSVLSARHADHVLILAGYRPLSLVIGRFLFVAMLGAVLGASLWRLMVSQEKETDQTALVLGLGLSVAVSIPLGLAVSLIFAQELEGTLLLIGIVGIQLSLADGSAVARWLPLYGPVELFGIAAGFEGDKRSAIQSGILYGTVMFFASYHFWHGRVQPRPRFRIPDPAKLPPSSRDLVPWHWKPGFVFRSVVAVAALVTLIVKLSDFDLVGFLPPAPSASRISERPYERETLSSGVETAHILCLTARSMRIVTPGQTLTLERRPGRGAAVCWIGPQAARVENRTGVSMLSRYTITGDPEDATRDQLVRLARQMTSQEATSCNENPCSSVDLAIVRPDGTITQPASVKRRE